MRTTTGAVSRTTPPFAVLRSVIFAATFAVAVFLGRLTVMDGTSLSLVWPAAGVAVVWFTVQRGSGTRVLDLTLLSIATMVLNLTTGATAALAGAFVLANVAQVLTFEHLFTRWCPQVWGGGGTQPLAGVAQLMRLVAAATLSTAAGALIGPTAVGLSTGHWSWLAAVVWMTRNTVSILLLAATAFRVGCLITARRTDSASSRLSVPVPPLRWPRGSRLAELAAAIATSVVAYGLIFGVFDGLPVAFPLIALTAWVALRFDTTIVLVHDLVVGVVAVLLTLAGHGPFASIADDTIRAIVVQLYVGVLAAVGLVLALVRDERELLLVRMAATVEASTKSAAEAEARGELAQAILDSIDVGIVVADADGRLLMFNPAARDMHGLDADGGLDPAHHAGAYDLHRPDGTGPLNADEVPLARILEDGLLAHVEMLIAPQGRARVTVTCSGRAMTRADGTPLGAVVAMTDISALRRAERELNDARQATAEQAELLELIFANVSDGIRVMDRGGEILLNNAAADRMLPVPGPGGLSDWDERYGYFDPEAEQPLTLGQLPLVRAMAGEQVEGMSMLVRNLQCPEGVVLSISARPLPGPDGPRGAVAVFRDVTHDQRQQAALRRSEAQLQRTFDASLVGNVHLTLDGTVVRANAAAGAIVGWTPQELAGRSWKDFIHPDDLGARVELLNEAITGQAEDTVGGSVRHLHRQGHTVHTLVSTAVVRDENGRPMHLASQLVDMSDRVKAEEKLRRQRDVYSRLLRALSDLGEGVLVEHDDQVTYVNDAFARLTGRRTADLLTLPTSLLLVPDDEQDAWRARKDPQRTADDRHRFGDRLTTARAARTLVTAFRRPDGVSVPVEVTTLALPDASGSATLTIVRDLSERLQAQATLAAAVTQLKEANRLKDDLVATLSHDLRQPLSTTIGFAELLLDDWEGTPEEEKRSHLARIQRAGQWANDLLEDILTMAQLEQGAPPVHATRVHLPSLVADLLDRLGPDAASVDANGVQDVTVLADRSHVERILGNLLGNAFKYGRAPVRLTTRRHRGTVTIDVVDAGEGVPEEFVPDLFARFTRAASGVALQKKGTGLGLYIARTLANANGGDLTYRPATSGGSRFALTVNGLEDSAPEPRNDLARAVDLPHPTV